MSLRKPYKPARVLVLDRSSDKPEASKLTWIYGDYSSTLLVYELPMYKVSRDTNGKYNLFKFGNQKEKLAEGTKDEMMKEAERLTEQ